jgi:hypothetical protein
VNPSLNSLRVSESNNSSWLVGLFKQNCQFHFQRAHFKASSSVKQEPQIRTSRLIVQERYSGALVNFLVIGEFNYILRKSLIDWLDSQLSKAKILIMHTN